MPSIRAARRDRRAKAAALARRKAREKARKKARRRAQRRATAAAAARSLGQLVVVLAGGGIAGGLLVLAAVPGATGPVPPTGSVAGAGAVAVATFWCARRLRPEGHPRGR